ncbi:MAG TPA: cell wall-binding repeat-containing protein [Bacillales bacterium]|nr:cell wall-binding repeat-containing protein [Bacillales bacterium]
MKKLHLPFFAVICLLAATLFSAGDAMAAGISVKLVNYLGNRTAVDFTTAGTFQVAGNNTRIAGADRFEVAYNVADNGWSKADNVILVNYQAFADALAAAPLAYQLNAPILLTRPDELSSDLVIKISELGATKVYIIGGTGSVSSFIEDNLKLQSLAVERIPGSNRYEVAQNVAAKIGNSSSAILASGEVFSDALSIAPYAAKNGIPILLTSKNTLPSFTSAALAGKSSALVIGGTGSVSSNVYNQLNQQMPNQVRRISGANRYEVSANIIKDPSLNLNAQTVYLSSGDTFADALTGSVLAAKQNSPLLLTSRQQLSSEIKQAMIDTKTENVNILGGTGSVSSNVEANLPNGYYLKSGTTYTVKINNGDLGLYNGATQIKNFGTEPITVNSSYSTANRLDILTGTQRSYLGTIEFDKEGSYVRPMSKDLPIEEYIKGVVPREMPASWNEEALKAQSVAARTFVARYSPGTIINDTTSYQVYGGYVVDPYTDKINRVVAATSGQVLRQSDGQLITAFFSSSNGGMTLTNTNTYGTSKVSYLGTKADPYDLAATSNPYRNWSYSIKKTQIDMTGKDLTNPSNWWTTVSENVNNANIIANMKTFLTTWKDASGNYYVNPNNEIKIVDVPSISFTTSFSDNTIINGSVTLGYYLKDKTTGTYMMENGKIKKYSLTVSRRAYDIRSMIGTDVMRGPYVKSVNQTTDAFTVNGGGWGHGMGMSQYGANEMGKQGFSYQQILQFYYPNIVLGK